MWADKEFKCFWYGEKCCNTDVEIPNKPGKNYTFDKDSMSWVVDKIAVLYDKLAAIKTEYAKKMAAGATCTLSSGKQIKMDCLPENYIFLLGGLRIYERENAQQIQVRDYNNAFHTVTLDEFKDLLTHVELHGKNCLEWKWREDLAAEAEAQVI